MRLNPFKKNPVKKEKNAIFKEVKMKMDVEIKEIDKLTDPAARAARYEAVSEKMRKFHGGHKPTVGDYNSDGAFGTGFAGGIAGFLSGGVGAMVAIPAVLTVPYLAIPAIVGITLGGAASGAVGGAGVGGFFSGHKQRKELRAKFGSLKNARTVYKLREEADKKAEKDRTAIRTRAENTNLRERVKAAYEKPAAETKTSSSQQLKLKI